MRFAAQWADLERVAPRLPGHLRRRIPIRGPVDVYLALEEPTGCRMMVLAFEDPVDISPLHELNPKGLDVGDAPFPLQDAGPSVSISARSVDFNEIFALLADDVISAADGLETAQEVVDAVALRLGMWQRFLQRATPDGLSAEEQAGLFGELWFLLEKLAPRLGAEAALGAWRGPLGGIQDFQAGSWAVEVKTSRQLAPASVRIANERQLQSDGLDLLALLIVALEQRSGGSSTLNEAVAGARTLVAGTPEVARVLEDMLLSAGYVDEHARRYQGTSYTVRWTLCALVQTGFPRLTEADLPPGVGDVSYSLSLDACKAFGLDLDELIERLGGPA